MRSTSTIEMVGNGQCDDGNGNFHQYFVIENANYAIDKKFYPTCVNKGTQPSNSHCQLIPNALRHFGYIKNHCVLSDTYATAQQYYWSQYEG